MIQFSQTFPLVLDIRIHKVSEFIYPFYQTGNLHFFQSVGKWWNVNSHEKSFLNHHYFHSISCCHGCFHIWYFVRKEGTSILVGSSMRIGNKSKCFNLMQKLQIFHKIPPNPLSSILRIIMIYCCLKMHQDCFKILKLWFRKLFHTRVKNWIVRYVSKYRDLP